MTRRVNTLIMVIVATLGLAFAVATLVPNNIVQATSDEGTKSSASQACEALRDLGDNASCDGTADSRIVSVTRVALNILSLIIGIASVFVIVVSGFRFVVSGGDANAVQGARNGIIYALVGIVIVVFAQSIVAFVLEKVDDGSPAEARGSSIMSSTDTLA